MRANSPKQRCPTLWYPMYLAGVSLATVGNGGRSILRLNTWKSFCLPIYQARQDDFRFIIVPWPHGEFDQNGILIR